MKLQGKFEAAVEDVMDIGRVIGLKYKGGVMNRFNVLSKEGRRRRCRLLWREVCRMWRWGERGRS